MFFDRLKLSKKIQKGSVETKSPWMCLGDHHFRNLFFKNLNFYKMSFDEFHGQIFSLQHLRQRILEFIYLSKLNIFENLVKNEDFWKFGQNLRFFKFGKNWRFFKRRRKLLLWLLFAKSKFFVISDTNFLLKYQITALITETTFTKKFFPYASRKRK